MTLGGLALAVGILVDDATVEIENIERNLAQGKELRQAILDGAQQIALPAFVSTLCICIVFVPMFFLTGVAHYLFVPLAEAVVFAMLASYVLSRTLIPTLVMYFLRSHRGHIGVEGAAHEPEAPSRNPFVRLQRRFEAGFSRFRESYRSILEWSLTNRSAVFLWFFVFLGFTACLVPFLGQDFFPSVDAGQFLLHVRAKSGTRIEETARLLDLVEQSMRKKIRPNDLGAILDNIGVPISGTCLSYSNSGVICSGDADVLVSLKPGHRPTEEYQRELRISLSQEFPGTAFYFLPSDIIGQTLNFGLPAPFDIQFVGRNVAKSREIAARLADKIRKIPGAVDIRVQQPADLPKLRYAVDRTKAAEVGLTEKDIANNVLLSVSGSSQVDPGYWLNPRNGVSYLINARIPEYRLDSLDVLNNLPVGASQLAQNNGQVLSNVATVTRGAGPVVLSHYNVQPVIDLYGGVSGRDLGSVLKEIEPLVDQASKEIPKGTQVLFRGQAKTMHDSFVGLGWGLVFAIALIYLLLVVNFQSWLDPFIIITALPGALAGVIWILFIWHTTLSVPALMGAIMSLGVATANSVLVVTFARHSMEDGANALAAALAAGYTRLRPVVMTALAMIIGMFPMALGLGEGGEQNAPLGRAVIGGLLVATLATLFFVPVVFAAIHLRRPVSSGVLLPDEEPAAHVPAGAEVPN
jgi:multidrug efflux pump subunit AcrB